MEKHLIRNYDVSEAAEAIASAAILVMGRIFTGPTHMQAVLNFFRDTTVTQAEKDSVLTKTGDEEHDRCDRCAARLDSACRIYIV